MYVSGRDRVNFNIEIVWFFEERIIRNVSQNERTLLEVTNV